MGSDQIPDDQLLKCIARGDTEAFSLLFRRRRGDVYRFALHMTARPAVADDVAQETFLAVLRDAGRYDAARAMRTLVQRVESEEPEAGGHDAVQRLLPLLALEKLHESRDGQRVGPLSAIREPLLEDGLGDVTAFEERTATQRGCRPERLVAALRDQAMQRRDVAVHGHEVEAHDIAVDGEDARGAAERVTGPEQDLPEVVPSVLVRGIAPEEGCQLRA